MQLTTVVLGLTAMISGSLAVAVPARDSFGSPELSVPADMQLQACAYPSCDACIEYCWGMYMFAAVAERRVNPERMANVWLPRRHPLPPGPSRLQHPDLCVPVIVWLHWLLLQLGHVYSEWLNCSGRPGRAAVKLLLLLHSSLYLTIQAVI